MYVLILIFSLDVGGVPGYPAAFIENDTTLNPTIYATLTACQARAAQWRSTRSNTINPDTGLRTIRTYECKKINP